MAKPLTLPLARVTDTSGNPVSGAKLYAYLTGTTTPTPTYTTAARNVQHTNPIVSDSAGLLPAIYVDPMVTYRFKAKTSAGTDISGMDFDPWSVSVSDEVQYTAAGTGAVTRTVQDKLRDVPLNVSDYASLSAAISAAVATGRTLEINSDHTLSATLTVTLTGALRIIHRNSPTITYVGSATEYAVRIITAGHPVEISGDDELTLDGDELASIVLRIENHTNTVANNGVLSSVRLRGVAGVNARSASIATGTTAIGINIAGAFAWVDVDRCRAENITAYSGGSRHGMSINRTDWALRHPRHVTVTNCQFKDVLVDDHSTDSDADGLAVFQNFVDDVTCYVDTCHFENCQGRCFKGQNGSAVPVLSNIKVYRNVPSLYGGVLPTQSGTKEFAFQYGVGKISNVTIEYEGEDIHEFGTIIADFGHPGTNENGELDFGFGEAVVRDVNIFDRTTGGSAIRCIMAPTYTADDTGEGVRARMIEIKNIKIVGGLLGSIVWMQSLGQYQPVELTIEGVQATFDSNANGAAIMEDTGAGNYDKLLATVRKFNNLGSDELAVINTGSASYNHGQWLDGGGNKNVKIDRGEWGASLPGLRKRTLANWTDAATVVRSYCGGSFEESYEIRNGQTVSLPMIGDGTFNLWVKVRGLGAVGEYKVVLNTAAITQVSAGGGVDLGSNNGTEPSLSGTELGLWHDTTADVIKAKANGANLYVTFRAFGG